MLLAGYGSGPSIYETHDMAHVLVRAGGPGAHERLGTGRAEVEVGEAE